MENIYKTHGAKLVNAHGSMTGNKKNVPKNTVLMFLSNPGYCTSVLASRKISHDFFEHRNTLDKFMSGNVPKNYFGVSNIKNRTHVPGNTYNNMKLHFIDKEYKSIGYVKKLPLTTSQHILQQYLPFNKVPTFAETAGPVRGTRTKLSNLLSNTGPGVYIIASCRGKNNNTSAVNTPSNSWPYTKPIHPKNSNLRRKNNLLKLEHPGTVNFMLKSERDAKKSFLSPKAKLDRVLSHMSRTSGRNTLRSYVAPLPANTNLTLIGDTWNAVKNSSKLPLRIRTLIKIWPLSKAQIIYNYLKSTKP